MLVALLLALFSLYLLEAFVPPPRYRSTLSLHSEDSRKGFGKPKEVVVQGKLTPLHLLDEHVSRGGEGRRHQDLRGHGQAGSPRVQYLLTSYERLRGR